MQPAFGSELWIEPVQPQHPPAPVHPRQQRRGGARADIAEENLHLFAHPLLAAWGKQGRDFIGLLDEHDSDTARAGYLQHFVDIRQRIDLFASHGRETLLNQLQDDIRDLRPLSQTRAEWPPVAPGDDSIRFHIAHSAQREVEVLHDQLADRWLLTQFSDNAGPGFFNCVALSTSTRARFAFVSCRAR